MSTAGDVVATFNLTSYIPADIQTDVQTGASYYQQFSQATQGLKVGPNGSIQLSDTAAGAAEAAIVGVVAAAVPVLGVAFAALMELVPAAGAGPGACNNPPSGSSPSQIAAWPNYTPWTATYPAYPLGAPGSFEAYANPILEYNRLLVDNCFPSKYVYPPIILAALIASWNAVHEATSTRTISRSGLGASGWSYPAGYDPIAAALEMALSPPSATNPFDTLAQGGSYQGIPGGVTSKFAINDGPLVANIHAITLHNPNAASMTGPTSTRSLTKSLLVGSLIVAGVGAAGIGVWALATHQTYKSALKGVWKSSGGRAVKAINPLPAVAAETFAGASRGATTIQTLIFPRPRYSESRAKAWARAHGHTAHKTDVTSTSIRLRQRSPEDFKKSSFRTITLGKSGVRAVIGHLR